MSERGVFAVDRGIFDQTMFESKEPFSKREAWVWMLAEAEWRPHKRSVSGKFVDLQRGQFVHSIRFMAEAWGWSKSAVSRFLDRLKNETMIGTDTGTGQIVVTICKYDEYQKVSLPRRDDVGTLVGTEVGQQRDRLESIESIEVVKEPNGSLSETDISDVPKPRKRKAYPEQFDQSWSLYPTDPNMSKAKTFDAWKKLDEGDRLLLIQSIPAFKESGLSVWPR